ncbi:hypothetical protein ACWDGI_43220 [Streptomyces sp. NPDC001220]
MAFYEHQFELGRNTAMERLESYRGLSMEENPSLYMAAKAFFDRIELEGRQINAGWTPVEDPQVVQNLVRELKNARAFSVRADWWIANQNNSENRRSSKWAASLKTAAETHVYNTGAWSKTTGMPAELRAMLNNGRTLETSPGAAFIDAIPTGFDRATPAPTLNYMWGHASETFMGESRGTVHADVYRGIDESSVLNKIEMPMLLQKMEAGEVNGVTFHVRKRNQQTGVLDETATYTVHSRASWDQVPTLDRTPSYFEEQGREYQTQQVARSILKNRQGVQHSLHDFEGFLNWAHKDVDTAVFMTRAGAELPPRIQVTPQQMAGWKRHPSLDSQAGQNWPAGTSPAKTLHDKLAWLADLAATQGSVSSASTRSGSQAQANYARTETYRSTQSTGSGHYLVPVNTVASNQWGMYMSPGPLQQLSATGQTTYTPPIPTNPAMNFNIPHYGPDQLTRAMTNMSMESPRETGHHTREGYFDPYYGANASNLVTSPIDYGAGASNHNPRSYYPTTSGSTANYTMNTAPSNPTGGYAQPVQGTSPSNRSTSSSEGIGEPLTRVNRNSSPPPAQRTRGGR